MLLIFNQLQKANIHLKSPEFCPKKYSVYGSFYGNYFTLMSNIIL